MPKQIGNERCGEPGDERADAGVVSANYFSVLKPNFHLLPRLMHFVESAELVPATLAGRLAVVDLALVALILVVPVGLSTLPMATDMLHIITTAGPPRINLRPKAGKFAIAATTPRRIDTVARTNCKNFRITRRRRCIHRGATRKAVAAPAWKTRCSN